MSSKELFALDPNLEAMMRARENPDLAWANAKVQSALLREGLIRLAQHLVWVAVVFVVVALWTRFDVESIAVNFAVAVAALFSIINPPDRFASLKSSDLRRAASWERDNA